MKNTSKNLLSFATFLCIPLTFLVINELVSSRTPLNSLIIKQAASLTHIKERYSKMQGQYFYNNTTGGNTVPAASFTLSAVNLYDGAVGDTTSGYPIGGTQFISVLVDLGSVQTISAYELAGNSPGYTVSYSSNGTAWTTAASVGAAPTATKVLLGSAVSCRYFQATFNGPSGQLMTDFRIYDSTGAVVVGQAGAVAPAPVAPTVPTLGATTTGVSTLPVNTQALTTNATSEVVNVYTNSAGTTPISGSPFAVPTPGTAVNVTLVSGTQYYISIGMVGTSGTTNGPLLAELFDVIGPVIVSAVIQPSGNVLVVTHTEYSQPLQANGSLHSLTGLTGGPDTLASPVYGGTTITYTLSRTVISTETGGLLNAPAGAFKDSAVPTNNSSPVVTNLAVVNNSTTAALPTAPTGVLVNPGNNLNTINWTNGTGSTSSNIYRCLTVGGTYVKLTAGTNVTAVTFTDATAVNGTTYFYEVSNSNSGGEGPLSSPGVSGTPYLPGGSSSPPTGLTATYVAGVGIQLSWTNAAGNAYTGVNVYRLSGGSVNGIFQRIDPAVNQPLAVTTSFLDKPGLGFTSLTGSASHAYAVCGIVNNVETVLSNITSLVTFLG